MQVQVQVQVLVWVQVQVQVQVEYLEELQLRKVETPQLGITSTLSLYTCKEPIQPCPSFYAVFYQFPKAQVVLEVNHYARPQHLSTEGRLLEISIS